MPGAVILLCAVLGSAVHLQIDSAEGLDTREAELLRAELSSAIGTITGDVPNGDRLTRIAVRARRVSWRIQVSLERRDGALVVGHEQLDLTRDPRSWRTPIADALRRLLPEGRELAARRNAPATAPPPVVTAPAAVPAPVADAPIPTADPAPIDVTPIPPAPAASRGGFRVVPLLAIAAGVGATVVGARFVSAASDAIDEVPTLPTNAADVEDQQRAVFENAVLGSVLLSVGLATAVTGLVLLISD